MRNVSKMDRNKHDATLQTRYVGSPVINSASYPQRDGKWLTELGDEQWYVCVLHCRMSGDQHGQQMAT